MMFMSPALFIFFLVISVGRCQFVYNYEEADVDGTGDDSVDQIPSQYNSPSATNDQFQSRRVQSSNVQDEVRNTGSRRSSVRENTLKPETETQPPYEHIEESETPRNDQAQGPRRRKYRRTFREGTYVAPPQPPRVYSPSVFENIGLGQAPNGVYVPQDSFLNILKNPSYRQSTTSQYNPMPTYYQSPAIQGPTFYVEPTSSVDTRAPPNTQPAIQPSVRYADVSPSGISSDSITGNNVEMSNRRRTQTGRQSRQRRPNQSSSLPEPTVDIDALNTRPVIRDITPYIPQARQVTQPITSRTRQRQNSIQVSRTYSPSIFQNVRLGEAPDGIHIPEDSFLNVLRNPTRSQLPPRNTYENSQPSSHLPNHVDEEQNYFQPETSAQPETFDQPETTPSDSRRRSGQRSRTNNNSVRSMQRRTQSQANDEDSLRVYTAPISSQQQRRQQTSTRNSGGSRRRDGNTPEKRHNTPRQDVHDPIESSQVSSARQQQNYKPAKLAIAALPEDTDDDGIPGEAGVNYPTLHTIPKTSFSCAEQEHNGYYADLETSCQVFHLCQARGGKSSFLCSNGTIFSQEKFSCQWWYKVNCEESPKFYSINDNLYKTPEKKSSSRE